MKLPNTFQHILLVSLLIATAACAKDPMKKTPSPTEPASQVLWRQIQAEVGDAACDGPQQCHSIAVGAKSCGGPDSYLAWSSKGSDGKKLRSLVEQHVEARRAENAASDMASNCQFITDPGATCQAGRCVLQAPGFGRHPGSAI